MLARIKNSLIIFILLSLLSCSNKKENNSINNQVVNSIPKSVKINKSKKKSKFLKMKTDSLWNYLTIKQGGCLTGGQYNLFVKKSGEGCVMVQDKKWKIFFKRDKKELTSFLISKMGDTTTTQVHTCPFGVATIGELAVYSLQKIHSKNWFEFKEFNKYSKMESVSGVENHQVWLQNLLKDKNKRNILGELYLKESIVNFKT